MNRSNVVTINPQNFEPSHFTVNLQFQMILKRSFDYHIILKFFYLFFNFMKFRNCTFKIKQFKNLIFFIHVLNDFIEFFTYIIHKKSTFILPGI